MNTPKPDLPASDSDVREAELFRLLEQLIEDDRNKQRPNWKQVAAEHPELVDELRELWATAMLAEDFGSFSGDLRLGSEPIEPTKVDQPQRKAAPSDLPRRMGDYELLEEIGRGGMGVVYKAQQRSLGRTVAVKMILQGELASAVDVARFRAEAEAAAQLHHPNIVPVYEVGEENGQPFFSMKYIDETNLAKQLTDGPMRPRQAAEQLLPVVRAIAAAHQHGLLHRDLKPSNILIDEDGRPYVTDFGLAKRWSANSVENGEPMAHASLTQSGAILGTPGYMAPEQAAGKRGQVSPQTDVYSLGALLYAMLTGRAPFQGASPLETVMMVLEQDPLLPRLLNRNVDPDLEMIALKCLQKPADLRYQDANELANDLEAYLTNEPISARSSQFSKVLSLAFRETHHAAVLESWGLLWMLHSAVIFVLCLLTNWIQWQGITSRLPYLTVWTLGLGAWAALFWNLRRRSGPITFVERQIAHVWAGSMATCWGLYVVEAILHLPVLSLSPVLGLVSGMVFLVKAGILSGGFYIQAFVLFLTAAAMAVLQQPGMPNVGVSLFGLVSAGCFFFPGLKYYRRRERD